MSTRELTAMHDPDSGWVVDRSVLMESGLFTSAELDSIEERYHQGWVPDARSLEKTVDRARDVDEELAHGESRRYLARHIAGGEVSRLVTLLVFGAVAIGVSFFVLEPLVPWLAWVIALVFGVPMALLLALLLAQVLPSNLMREKRLNRLEHRSRQLTALLAATTDQKGRPHPGAETALKWTEAAKGRRVMPRDPHSVQRRVNHRSGPASLIHKDELR